MSEPELNSLDNQSEFYGLSSNVLSSLYNIHINLKKVAMVVLLVLFIAMVGIIISFLIVMMYNIYESVRTPPPWLIEDFRRVWSI